VPISWTLLPDQLRRKDFITEIAPLLPERYSPIRADGNGNQAFYLCELDSALGNLLLQLAGSVSLNHETALDDLEESRLWASDTGPTEKEQLVLARRGQGIFRKRLERVEKRCRLTGVDNPRSLIASHIKPWRSSSDTEKLDGYNGLLLAPHVDKLFDGAGSASRMGVPSCARIRR
jgi:hypothetical protein